MTVSTVSAGRLLAWHREITSALDETLSLFESTYGYPPGSNDVLLASEESRSEAAQLEGTTEIPPALIVFYTTIAELRLPDVDHGYFIHSPVHVLNDLAAYGPVHVTEHATGIVFGSDGGGILFALGHDGRVHRSTTASWFVDFEMAAPSLGHFLDHLHRAVADFAANGRAEHL
ncbi:hypothetical protein [Kitasatospora sp. McL0602]|uniref:hypothetical protein n=1 Tax=Kitasatospora sp. McL0602 TaxID=3439530 RepID=UPI003F8C2F10